MAYYSKIPIKIFELELVGSPSLKVSNGANNDIVVADETVQLFNAAIGGLFQIKKGPIGFHVEMEGSTMKSFDIILSNFSVNQSRLRIFTGTNAIYCSLVPSNVHFVNTALMICMQSSKIAINVKLLGQQYGSINWDQSSFNITDTLKMENEIDTIPPNVWYRCPHCLTITPEGDGHQNPCPPKYTISAPREHILSSSMMPILKLKSLKAKMMVFDHERSTFIEVDDQLSFINDIIDGIFTFKTFESGDTVMTFEASSIKRFSIIFAVLYKNAWRLRLRLVVTLNNGVIGFPMTKTLFVQNDSIQFPEEFRPNTVLMLGLHSDNDIKLALRVFANANGADIIKDGEFNGFSAIIKWDCHADKLEIPLQLQPAQAEKRQFNGRLYRANGEQNVSCSVWKQRFVPTPVNQPKVSSIWKTTISNEF